MRDDETQMLTSGTCIVAVRTPNEIVIGADSFENVRDEEPAIVCKIGIVGDIVFATAGLSRVFDGETLENHFTVREIVRSEIEPHMSIEENLCRIVSAVEKKVKTYFAATKSEGEKREFLGGLNKPIEILLGRYEGNILQIAAKRLMRWAPDDRMELYATVLPPCAFPGLRQIDCYLAGTYDATLENFDYHRLMETTDLVGTVEDAILIQARNDVTVGSPIRIVQINKAGISWRRGEEGCV